MNAAHEQNYEVGACLKEVTLTCDKYNSSRGFSVSDTMVEMGYGELKLGKYTPQNHPTATRNAKVIQVLLRPTFSFEQISYEVKHRLTFTTISHAQERRCAFLQVVCTRGSRFHAQTTFPTFALMLALNVCKRATGTSQKTFIFIPISLCRR